MSSFPDEETAMRLASEQDRAPTAPPWVGFSDQGKCVAIMPAMREGDICTFAQPPSDADAQLMIAAPNLLAALVNVRQIITEGAMEGFNPLVGDWAERLFESQRMTSNAIRRATPAPHS